MSQYAADGAGIYDLVGSVDEWTRTQRVEDFVTSTDSPQEYRHHRSDRYEYRILVDER